MSISDIFFKCLSALTQWRLCPIQRLQCVDSPDFFAAEVALAFPYGNASHSTFVVSRSTWLRCSGSPRPHMPEEICVSQSIIKTLPNSPAFCQTNAHTYSSNPRYFWQYFILQLFFQFYKNSILMYLLTPKKLSKIDLLIIDELSYISFNKYQSKLIQLFRMK